MSYITIADVRAADPTGGGYTDFSDAQIQLSIDNWQSFIETHTRRFFESRNLELNLDGEGGRILHLPIPIISLEKLQVNRSGQDEDLNYIAVYNGRGMPRDDRDNPKIAIIADLGDNIYTGRLYGALTFKRGYQNQYLKGDFGYTESDDSTPSRIKWALLRLVCRELDTALDPLTPITPPGTVTKEVTDGHSIQWGTTSSGGGGIATESLTGDKDIDQVIMDYRAPAHIGVSRIVEQW